MKANLVICDTCRFSTDEKERDGRTGGEILAAHVERLAGDLPELGVRRFSCLMGCEHHCNVGLRQGGKLTYVMGSFEPTIEAAEAIVDFARKYAASETGQVPYRTWPKGVKGHFVSRVPPLDGE